MHILATGGAGYIGSHTCLVLLEAGHQVTVLDNLSNSAAAALRRGDVAALTADPSLAQAELGWRAELGIEAMCEDA